MQQTPYEKSFLDDDPNLIFLSSFPRDSFGVSIKLMAFCFHDFRVIHDHAEYQMDMCA
jgi:hypothetical protein